MRIINRVATGGGQVLIQVQLMCTLQFCDYDEEKKHIRYRFFTAASRVINSSTSALPRPLVKNYDGEPFG